MKNLSKGLLLSILLLVSSFCLGKDSPQSMTAVHPNGSVTVHVYNKPCPEIVSQFIPPASLKEFKEGKYVFKDGKTFVSCWKTNPQSGSVLFVDEAGDVSNVPMNAFKPDIGT